MDAVEILADGQDLAGLVDVTERRGQTVALPIEEPAEQQSGPQMLDLSELVDVTERRGQTVELPVARRAKWDLAAIRRRYLAGFGEREGIEAEAANRIWLARTLGLEDPAGIEHETLAYAVYGQAKLTPVEVAERIGEGLRRRWEPDQYEQFLGKSDEEQVQEALGARDRWGAFSPEDMERLWSAPGSFEPMRTEPDARRAVLEHAERLLGASRKRRIAYWEDELSPRAQLLAREVARKVTEANMGEVVEEYLPRLVALDADTRAQVYDYIGALTPDLQLPWWNVWHGLWERGRVQLGNTVKGAWRVDEWLDQGAEPAWQPSEEETVATALQGLRQGQRIEQAVLGKFTREALSMLPYMALAKASWGTSTFFEYVGRQSDELVAAGVAPEAALVGAVVSGIPYAAIEKLQAGKVMKAFGWGKHAGREAFLAGWTQRIGNRYARWAATAGVNTAWESVGEGLQGAVEAETMAYFLEAYGAEDVARAAYAEFAQSLGPMGMLELLGLGTRKGAGAVMARLRAGDVGRLSARARQVEVLEGEVATERQGEGQPGRFRAVGVYRRWVAAEGGEARREVLRGAGYEGRELAQVEAMFAERELGERALGPVIEEVAADRRAELERERDRVIEELTRAADGEGKTEDGRRKTEEGRGETEDGKRKTEEDQGKTAEEQGPADQGPAAAELEAEALAAGVPIDLPADAIQQQVKRRRSRRAGQQQNILQLARNEVPKLYLSTEDLRELKNAKVPISPRFVTKNKSAMSWDQAVQYFAEHYPGLGVEPDTEMSELVRLVYQGKAADFAAQDPADSEPVFAADVEIGDVIRGEEVVVDRSEDGGAVTIDSQGRVTTYPARETVAMVTEMGHADDERTVEARARAGLEGQWERPAEAGLLEADFAVTVERRRGTRAAQQKVARFEGLAAELAEAAPGAFPVSLVGEQDLPADVREELARYRQRFPEARPKGVRTAEGVYLLPDNLASEAEFLGTWLHEQVVHVGLRQALGEGRLEAVLDEVAGLVGAEGLRAALPEAYHGQAERVQAEEYLARLAERVLDRESLSEAERTVWQRVLDWLRQVVGEVLGRDELAARIAAEMELGGPQALRLAGILRDGLRGIRQEQGAQERAGLLFDMTQAEFGGLLDEVAAKRVEQRAEGIAQGGEGVPEWVRATARNVLAEVRAGRVTDYAAAMAKLDGALAAAGRQQTRLTAASADAQPELFGDRGTLFSLAGEGAESVGNADRARELEREGATREAIWQDTGWYKGADGRWRFEIDDSQMRLTGKDAGDLPMLIEYPALFDAYPDMRGVFAVIDRSKTAGGSYHQARPQTDTTFGAAPEIRVEAETDDKIRTVLAHEIQHAIQEIEGFARGGSIGGEARRNHEAEQRLSRINHEMSWLAERMEKARGEARAELAAQYNALKSQKLSLRPDLVYLHPGEQYLRLAGEAEARVVSRRLDLTTEQRKAEPPWVTMDTMLREEGLLGEGQTAEDVLIVRGREDAGVRFSLGDGDRGRVRRTDADPDHRIVIDAAAGMAAKILQDQPVRLAEAAALLPAGKQGLAPQVMQRADAAAAEIRNRLASFANDAEMHSALREHAARVHYAQVIEQAHQAGLDSGLFLAEARARAEQRRRDQQRDEGERREYVRRTLGAKLAPHKGAQGLWKELDGWMSAHGIEPAVRHRVNPMVRRLFDLRTEKGRKRQLGRIIDRLTYMDGRVRRGRDLARLEALLRHEQKPRKDAKGRRRGLHGPEVVKIAREIGQFIELDAAGVKAVEARLAQEAEELFDAGRLDEARGVRQREYWLAVFGNLRAREGADVGFALDTLEGVLKRESTAWQLKEERRLWEAQQTAREVVDALGGLPGEVELAEGRKRRSGRRLIEAVKGGAWKTYTLGQKLDMLADEAGPESGAGVLVQQLKRRLHVANQQTHTGTLRAHEALRAEADRIWGKGKGETGLAGLYEMAPEAASVAEMARDRVSGQMVATGARQSLSLTRGQALQVLLGMDQPSLAENFAANGYDEQTFGELEGFVGPEARELGRFLVRELDGEWFEVNPLYRELFGIDMGRHENYFPFRPTADRNISDAEAFDQQRLLAGQVKPGALIERVLHTKSVDTTVNAVDTYLWHRRSMEHFKAFGLLARDAYGVLGRRMVQRAMSHRFGDRFTGELLDHLRQTLGGGNPNYARNPAVMWARNVYVGKVFWGNVRMFAKQISSFPAYWMDPEADVSVLGPVAALATEQGRSDIARLIRSDFVQNRWEQGQTVEAMYLMQAGRTPGAWNKIVRAGMWPVRTGDLVPILLMGREVYRRSYDAALEAGLSEAEADREGLVAFGMAAERTQQSQAWQDRTAWQRQGDMGVLMSAFTTSPRMYTTMMVRAVQRAAASGSAKDRLQAAKTLAIGAVVLPVAFQLAGTLYDSLLAGQWPEEDDELWRELVAGMLKSPAAAVYMLGKAAEYQIDRQVLGRSWTRDPTMLTDLVQDAERLAASGYGLVSGEKDVAEVARELGRILPAVRQAETAATADR